MSKFFVLRLNKIACEEMFGSEQAAMRIQVESGVIKLKSAVKIGTYTDAYLADVGKNGVSVKITGAAAPTIAKLFIKQGFAAENAIFSLEKDAGRGGWYSITHLENANLPRGEAAFKVEIPDDIDAVAAEAPKKTRKVALAVAKKGKAAKPVKAIGGKKRGRKLGSVNKPKTESVISVIAGNEASEMMARFEQMLTVASSQVNYSERKAGRPRTEIVEAQNIILNFERLVQKFLGTTSLASAMSKFEAGIALMSEGLAVMRELEARHTNTEIQADFQADAEEIIADEPVIEATETVDEPVAEIVEETIAEESAVETTEPVAEIQEPAPEPVVQETVVESISEKRSNRRRIAMSEAA